MNYPIAIHKDRNSDYGDTVPDLPGCFTAGRTVDEALATAREAIELHLEGLIEDGQPLPRPSSIERQRENPDYRGATWALVSIDPANLRLAPKRVNITIPERILDAVDRFAREEGATRSGLLVQAVTEYIDQRQDKPRSKARRKTRAMR